MALIGFIALAYLSAGLVVTLAVHRAMSPEDRPHFHRAAHYVTWVLAWPVVLFVLLVDATSPH